MQVLIWGAGAIGGTVGAWLARAGHEVVLVDRDKDHVWAINKHGLKITGPVDEFTVQVPAFTPDKLKGTCEHVLLCVKAQDTAEAARALVPHVARIGYVASFQNGLNELTISEIVGQKRTIGAFVNFGADYIEPGVIHRGNRGAVVLGELDGRITRRLRELHQTILDFDDRAIMTKNIWGYLWGKLSYGSMLFATALTNESIADALAMPEYHDLYIELAGEVLRVALARGVKPEGFNGFSPDAFLPGTERSVSMRSLEELVVFNRGSAKTHSGIWRDLAVRKRKTEADAQLGPIIKLGAEAGVPTPITSRVKELIHEIEDDKRALSLKNLELVKAVINEH